MRKIHELKYKFESISNEKEAYILGYLYADGYILSSPHYRIGISLAIKDEEILTEMRDYISDDIPILYEERGRFKSCKFYISRKEVCENIIKIGMLPNKTHIDYGLPDIDENLIPHFIRGFFDGDGSCINDRGYLIFYICSPLPKIVVEMGDFLRKNGISSSVVLDKRKGKKSKICKSGIIGYDQYRLLIRKNIHLEALYKLLYENATIFLKRKYNIFKEYIERGLERESNNLELIEYNGETKTMKQWAEKIGIKEHTLKFRILNAKWDLKEALENGTFQRKWLHKEKARKGEDHPRSRFTNEQVIEIFKSKESNRELSKKYNVHRDTIYKIKAGINNKSVTKNI